jgi:hypothetical protein
MLQIVLRATNAAGTEFFYTGRAGTGWVSVSPNCAFVYSSPEGARAAAERHNKWEPLHGLHFTPVVL